MKIYVPNHNVYEGFTEVRVIETGVRFGRPSVHVEAVEGEPFCRQTCGGPAQYRDAWYRPDSLVYVEETATALDMPAALVAAVS